MQFSAQPLPSDDVNPVEEAKNQTAPDHRQKAPFHVPDFSNFEEAHKPKSNLELVRAYGVFTTCQIRPVVKYADTLLGFTKKVLGANITYSLVRATFFGHFCAGKATACFGTTALSNAFQCISVTVCFVSRRASTHCLWQYVLHADSACDSLHIEL